MILDVIVWLAALGGSLGLLVWIFGSPGPDQDEPVSVPCLLCHAVIEETQALRLRNGKGYVCASHDRSKGVA